MVLSWVCERNKASLMLWKWKSRVGHFEREVSFEGESESYVRYLHRVWYCLSKLEYCLNIASESSHHLHVFWLFTNMNLWKCRHKKAIEIIVHICQNQMVFQQSAQILLYLWMDSTLTMFSKTKMSISFIISQKKYSNK
jgi:hypothetical protein